MEQYQKDLALFCGYAIEGRCSRHGHKCWNYHPPKACPHIEKKICEVCHFPSTCQIVCPAYLKDNCNDINCRYYHGKRRNKEIRRNRPQYSDLNLIAPDILKIIIADCYVSDLLMVNKWFNHFVSQYFPLQLYIYKDLFSSKSTAISIARKKNDAIFQIALRIFNYDKFEPKCKMITHQSADFKIKHWRDINLLEWQDEEFYLFRKKLLYSKYYLQDDTMIINSANMFLALKDMKPLIMPLTQCTTLYV